MSTKILMCSPEHFDVNYNINHWMNGQQGQVDRNLAIAQWDELFNEISRHTVVHLIQGEQNLPDLVFTANAGFIQGKTAVLSKFATKERQPEEAVFREWFVNHGCTVEQPSLPYEGEGDHLVDSWGRHWLGSGFRTDRNVAPELETFLRTKINVLELVDPRWYHLDTAFCPLPKGGVMWYPGAFSRDSRDLIRASFSLSVEVSEPDADMFCCNCICVGNNLFMPICHKIPYTLQALGYNVWSTDLSEFMKAGGAAKCLMLHMND